METVKKVAEEKDLSKAQEKLPPALKAAIEKKEGKKEESKEDKDKKPEDKKEGSKKEEESKKEDEAKKDEKDCTASSKKEFVRFAKMNGKTRTFLKDYYTTYFPKDFVEALLKDY